MAAPDRRLRSLVAAAAAMMLAMAGALVASPPRAQAAAPYDCGSVYAIQPIAPRNVWGVDLATGALSSVGTFAIANATGNLNAHGITNDGSSSYAILPANTGTGRSIYRYIRATDQTVLVGAGVAGAPTTHGAVNPQNGIYYYGGMVNGSVQIYGFNPATNASLGLVASGVIPTGGGNGDWAFDQQGRLYVVSGGSGTNVVTSIDQPIPATANPITITGSLITTITTPADQAINGIAFAGSGLLYLSSQQQLFEINPSTGALLNTRSFSTVGSVDLASCASPNTIIIKKNFVNGRISADDQVSLSVVGGGIVTGNTGTTAGNDDGLQNTAAEYAGPVFGLTGTSYTFRETGSGTVSPGYVSTWTCLNENNGAVIATGSGTTGSFVMPNGGSLGVSAVCTFTNLARKPALVVDKVASAPSGNTPGSTIRYTFTVTNTGNVPLTSVTVSDPKLGTVTCPAGQLNPGASLSCTAAPYALTQTDVNDGRVANTATATGTPTIAGLPSPTSTDSTVTPISQAPGLSLTKRAGSPVDVNGSGLTDAGDTITYTFDVTNTGNVTITSVGILDPKVGAIACQATTLPPGAGTSCATSSPYVITEGDEFAGAVDNTARARGTAPDGTPYQSNASSTSTPVVTPAPSLTLVKAASRPVDVNNSGITDAGDTIDYSFTVTNTGNVPLTGVVINDPLIGATTCQASSLAVGASTRCSSVTPYTVTEADETRAGVVNTATASGRDPDGGTTTSPIATTTTPTSPPTPRLTLTKTAGAPVDVNNSGITDAGDTITYSFLVINLGNVPISTVAVTDALVGPVTCPVTSLPLNGRTTCTSTPYVITEADESVGVVTNTATASGVDPDGGQVVSNPGNTNTAVTADAAVLTLDKVAKGAVDVNRSGLIDAGDTVAWTFTVTNEGNVPISTVAIIDPSAGAVSCPVTSLPVGGSTVCTSPDHVITEDEEVAGMVTNTATATGTNPDNEVITSNPDSTQTKVDLPAPSMTLLKQASRPEDVNRSGITDAGDRITFTFVVSNTGNVPIGTVSITDPRVGPVSCPQTRLAAGASMTCSAASYVVTEDDELAGSVDNTATLAATDPDLVALAPVTSRTSTAVTVPTPALQLLKQAGLPVDVNTSGITDAGDQIGYTFTVTNTGNVPVRLVGISDPKVGEISCDQTTLPAGSATICLAAKPYSITAAEAAAGRVDNTAVATAIDPDGSTVTSNESSTSVPAVQAAPRLTLQKTAQAPVDTNQSTITDAGDTIGWSFAVTNAGNVPVGSISIDDALVGPVTCQASRLLPGESTSCLSDAPHLITSADEEAGVVTNTALARGIDPDGRAVTSPEASTSTPVDTPEPALAVQKSAGTPVDVNSSGITDAGDTIAYTFAVTNTGNVPLRQLAISDVKVGTVTCQATDLAVGARTTCTADSPYRVTEADEAAAAVVNVATATAVDPDNGGVGSPTSSTSTPVVAPAPALVIDKGAGDPVDVNSSGITDAGDTIAYTFTVTNTGNVPISAMVVTDDLVGSVTCRATSLEPGASTTCAADNPYLITAANEDDRRVTNSAFAAGRDPDGGVVTSDPDSTNTPVTAQSALLRLDKVAAPPVDVNSSGLTDAGDTIGYTFTVTNDGNVLLSGIVITDELAGSVTCQATSLAVGASTSCAADNSYPITAADETAGQVLNTAFATAVDPDGDPTSSNVDTTTTSVADPSPALRLTKSAQPPTDLDSDGITEVGDTIAYTFTVLNIGNVPLSAVTIADPRLPQETISCADSQDLLAPGAVRVCTARYTIGANDIDAGEVVNTATASGTDPNDDQVTAEPATATVTIERRSGLVVTKSAVLTDADGDGFADVGESIVWTVVITNTGNVTLTAVTVDDPVAQELTCTSSQVERVVVPSLPPGASMTCTSVPHLVTQAEVDSGAVANTVTGTATAPEGTIGGNPSGTASTSTGADARARLDLVKSNEVVDANGNGVADAGEQIRYTFTVTNTGTVTVTEVAITDPRLAAGLISCQTTTLAPAQSTTCSGTYPVVAADVTGEPLVNSARAIGCVPIRSVDGRGDCAEGASTVISNEGSTQTPTGEPTVEPTPTPEPTPNPTPNPTPQPPVTSASPSSPASSTPSSVGTGTGLQATPSAPVSGSQRPNPGLPSTGERGIRLAAWWTLAIISGVLLSGAVERHSGGRRQ